MRVTFTSTDEFNEEREAIRFAQRVSDRIGRRLSQAETDRLHQVRRLAPEMVPGDDPLEIKPVKRAPSKKLFFTSGHSLPGTKGGEGHSGAELEAQVVPLLACLGGCVVILIAAII